MYVNTLDSCCGIAEIGDLSQHDNPQDAMRDFCNNNGSLSSNIWRGSHHVRVYPFYIFSGIESFAEDCEDEDEHASGYGSAFAKYIMDNKLGEVTTLSARPNRVNHPDHIIQVWLWSPDIKTLLVWMKEKM